MKETERKILEATGALYPAPAPLGLKSKLIAIQNELKAPKNRRNSFGGYNYRSCEDILESVKPLLKKYGVLLQISDEIEQRGDRYYVKATAYAEDLETDQYFRVSAYAREEESKKGMDGAQVTGGASSYARKYALNGLLLIDDNKDPDTDENAREKAARKAYKENTQAEEETAKTGYFCETCGKQVREDIARRSKEANNGHVYCSGRCRDQRPIETGGIENA